MRTVRDRPTLLQRFPNGVTGSDVLPEADPRHRARVAADHHRGDASTARVAGHRDGRHRPRALGRQPGLPRLPPVAVPGGRPGQHRRAAHRPRPVAGRRLRDGSRGRRRGSSRSSTSTASRASPRPPATAACTSTSASSRAGTPSPSARPPSRRPRDGAAPADLITGDGGRSSAGPCLPTSTRTRRTRRCSARGACGPGGAQVSTPFGWDELPTIQPDELTMATVPARVAARATRGRRSTTSRSRSSRWSTATAPTSPPASRTPRGRRSTRRCPTRRAA